MSDQTNLTVADLAAELHRFGLDISEVTRTRTSISGLRIEGGINDDQAVWLEVITNTRDDDGRINGTVTHRLQFASLVLASIEAEI